MLGLIRVKTGSVCKSYQQVTLAGKMITIRGQLTRQWFVYPICVYVNITIFTLVNVYVDLVVFTRIAGTS